MAEFEYTIEVFLPDGRRVVSWVYPSPEPLITETIELVRKGARNIVKTRKPEFKDLELKVVISLADKELLPPETPKTE